MTRVLSSVNVESDCALVGPDCAMRRAGPLSGVRLDGRTAAGNVRDHETGVSDPEAHLHAGCLEQPPESGESRVHDAMCERRDDISSDLARRDAIAGKQITTDAVKTLSFRRPVGPAACRSDEPRSDLTVRQRHCDRDWVSVARARLDVDEQRPSRTARARVSEHTLTIWLADCQK